MEELLRELVKEQKRTNELLAYNSQGKDPYELLTKEQIYEETGIGENMILKMFQDPKLPVQRYTRPFKVARKAFNDYILENHDYLIER